jgi:hypothetical protein
LFEPAAGGHAMIRTAFVVLAATIAATAFAQSTTRPADTARREVKEQLEGVRAPMFGDGKPLPDTTASYSVASTGCTTRVDISLPAHRVRTTDFAARFEQASIDWSKVSQVALWDSYVIVHAPGLPEGKRYFYAGSGPGAERLKANMDMLAGACFGPAAHTAPTAVSALSERVPEKSDVLGTPQCRFRAIPELLLTDNRPPVVKIATFRIPAQESGGKDTRFAFGAQPGDQIATWEGILANPQLVLDSDAHLNVQITRAEVTIDGRALSIPIAPNHSANPYQGMLPGKFYSTVSINPTSYNPGGLLAEIARGSTMVVRLYAGSREISYWTFDVSRLRHAPAALKGARWTCR